MKHKQFEKFLLTSEPLDMVKYDLLKNHLLSCKRCRDLENAWNSIEQDFNSIQMINPPSDFVTNWEKYKGMAKEKRAKRNFITLASSLLAISSTASVIMYLSSIITLSIPETLGLVFTKLGYLIAQFMHALRGFSSLFKAFPLFMPISTGIGISIFFMTLILFSLWIVSMLRIILPKQGVV